MNVSVCVRVLHGALEGRQFFRIPVSEWLQPKNDHEVPGSAGEVSCNLRHGKELHGSQDRPGQGTQGGENESNLTPEPV